MLDQGNFASRNANHMTLEQGGYSGFFGLAQMKLQEPLKIEEGGRRGDQSNTM